MVFYQTSCLYSDRNVGLNVLIGRLSQDSAADSCTYQELFCRATGFEFLTV